MISLQKLLTTDVDATSGVQSGAGKTSGDTAQDFLSLLAGALGGKTATGTGADGEATLTLADLQAASGKSLKNLRALSSDDAQTPAQKLADLLARQTAKTDTDTLTTDSKTQMQALLSGLTPETKSGVLAALGKSDTATDADSSDLSEEELAGLSALMAMLPHQQTAQLAPTKSTTDVATAADSALGATKRTGVDLASLAASAQKGDSDNTALQKTSLSVGDDAQQQAGIFGSAQAPAAKQDADNATMTINTTASIAPVISNASSAQASAPVSSAVLSAPLGSNEWQQTLSQHVTMFTRQGQQSAELHLHPEELGQVQISLKLDDNNLAQIQMMSPHSHVRQALEAALPTLRTSLAESGIQLGQSSISSESFAGQQQSFSQQQQSSRTGGGSNLATEEDEPLIAPASLQSVARGNGAVDIFA